jgi:hypothetical protein
MPLTLTSFEHSCAKMAAGLGSCDAEFAFNLSSNPGIGHLDAAPQRPLGAPPE